MSELYKFHSIEQFRTIARAVSDKATFVSKNEDGTVNRNPAALLPTLSFKGKVKIHGTNLSIVLTKDGEYYAQSRERIMELTSDNAGSCMYSLANKNIFEPLLKVHLIDGVKAIAVYGEWAGQSIQKGVGVSNLEKSFFVFGLKQINEDGSHIWLKDISIFNDPSINLFNIDMFQSFNIDIDFNAPERAINTIADWVLEVERECPVAKYFGFEGIGEGVVFNCGEFTFKAKGEKHSASKVKAHISVDVESIESIRKFVEYAVTENRLEQAVKAVTDDSNEPTMKVVGAFLSWINKDILKEEADTIIANELDVKNVSKSVSTKARNWFMSKYA